LRLDTLRAELLLAKSQPGDATKVIDRLEALAKAKNTFYVANSKKLSVQALMQPDQGNMEGISLVKLAVPSMVVMMSIIVFYFYKFGSFKHASFWLLMACHVPYLFVERIGDNEAIRAVLSNIFR